MRAGRRHRRRRAGRADALQRPRDRHRRQADRRLRCSTSGRATARACTTCSTATSRRCARARGSAPTTRAATASGRSSRRYYPVPDDGPVGDDAARDGPRTRTGPGHIHMMVSAPGHVPLTTHLFVEDSPYLDSDAVFGVRDSLVVEFEKHAARQGARRPRDGASRTTRRSYDFRLPATRLSARMKIGKATVPRTAICTSDDTPSSCAAQDLCERPDRQGLVHRLLLPAAHRQAAERAASRGARTRRWSRSPSTASCPACRRRA